VEVSSGEVRRDYKEASERKQQPNIPGDNGSAGERLDCFSL